MSPHVDSLWAAYLLFKSICFPTTSLSYQGIKWPIKICSFALIVGFLGEFRITFSHYFQSHNMFPRLNKCFWNNQNLIYTCWSKFNTTWRNPKASSAEGNLHVKDVKLCSCCASLQMHLSKNRLRRAQKAYKV